MDRERLKTNAEQQAAQEKRDHEESKLKKERAKQAAAHEQQMQRVERQLEEAKACLLDRRRGAGDTVSSGGLAQGSST